METQLRTIAKTISWRILGTLLTSMIAWILSGDKLIGLSIGMLDCLVKIVVYYSHERLWNKIDFGYRRKLSVNFAESGVQKGRS